MLVDTLRRRRLTGGVYMIDRPCIENAMRIDMGAVPMIAEMNRNGFIIDTSKLSHLSGVLTEHYERHMAEIESAVGKRINPNSSEQVSKLLFKELGLKLPGGQVILTSTGQIAADADTLNLLITSHPVVKPILSAREVSKLKNTYVDKLPYMLGSDGRLRTTLRQDVARTSRLSSEDPNLQNIPVRSELGREIRSAFVADTLCTLGSSDLSQIEMVWAGELSQDKIILDVFRHKMDMHVSTACAIFGLDNDEIQKLWKMYKRGELPDTEIEWMRDFELTKRLPSKTAGFAILYGTTAGGLRIQIVSAGGPVFTEDYCQHQFIDRFFQKFHGLAAWMDLQDTRMRRFGMVWNAFGRPRLVPEGQSPVRSIVNEGRRKSGNTPVQSSAGDHLKIAIAECWQLVKYYRHRWPNEICRALLQIHDELVFELSKPIADDFMAEVQYSFQTCVPVSVPVSSSVSTGEHWGMLK